jgi:2-polyprenyl-6-hydroxyphenyl methylase/3-demethylubiquinone-9 3-methyltransferase
MPVGSAVRKVLGRFEPAAIRAYRGMFIDLAALGRSVGELAPQAKRVLEIGCGDGALAAAVNRALPAADILGLDPGMTDPGRMYDGDPNRAQFFRTTSTELLAEHPEPFDVVLICDVIHHVAENLRTQVLRDAAALTAPDGVVVVKEWEHRGGLGTGIAYVADRYVSGDSTVRFLRRTELDAMLAEAMPGWSVASEHRIPPRKANLLLALRRG